MTTHPANASERDQRWDEVLVACLKALESDPDFERTTLMATYPEFASELDDFLAQRAFIWQLAQRDLPPTGCREMEGLAAERVVDSFGDYQILERIARGGMAVVYKARQISLNRLVALKMIHGHDLGAEEERRFRHEAEIVALLDHANIVPVYEVGEASGRVFYTMKLMEGGSLRDQLDRFAVDIRAAAKRVATIARAVQHAHQRGILHRDLKPSNILLDRDGSPCVTDFGLARRVAADSDLTQSGALLGTPSYMAPEQVRGQRSAITTATDIYGLGGILYSLLTGQPPFRGETVLETFRQVQEQEPKPPSQINRRVDRDLETICRKCMEREPGRRYSTATELADDLERYLAGEPIQARPIPLWVRAWKWARRRPALVAFSGLAVVLLFLGLWWHTTTLNAQVRKANDQQQRADRSYREARQAIMIMLDRLGKFNAPNVPQIEALRRDLNQDALAFFEGIEEDEAVAEPAVRFDVARALVLMGELLGKQGQPEAGARKLRHALRLLEQLVVEDSANPDYQVELGRCLDILAICLSGAENLQCLERALAVRQELGRREPGNGEWQCAVAVSHTNVGVAYHDRGDSRTAELHWQEARRIQEKLVRDHPGVVTYKELMAVSYSNLALLCSAAGRDTEAEPLLRKSVDVLDGLLRDYPEKRWVTIWNLVMTLRIQGGFLTRIGRGEEGRAILTRAIDLAEDLRKGDQHNPKLKELVTVCLAARIYSYASLYRPQDAENDWQRGFDLAAQANCWSELCKCPRYQAQLGAHALAAKWAQQLLRQKGLEDEDLYELVKGCSLATAAAHKDRQLTTVEQGKTAERSAAQAMALLEKLQAQGFFKDPAHAKALVTDTDLQALRERADFQRLLKDVKAAKK